MDQRFNEVYAGLYTDYAYDYGSPRRRLWPWTDFGTEQEMVLETRRAIEQLEVEAQRHPDARNMKLRSDAKLFLLSNFHLMVIVPLLEGENRYGPRPPSELNRNLATAIRQDLEVILEDAYSLSYEAGSKEVSGHSVMSSIDKNWKGLKTTSFRIWGGDE
jgi:phosphatidylinositol kinase/protein kinase (PI-3  family)